MSLRTNPAKGISVVRRDELVKSLGKVAELIESIEYDQLMPLFTGRTAEKGIDPKIILSRYATFTYNYNNLNAMEREVLTDFGLDALKDVSFWANAINRNEASQPLAYEINFKINVLKRSVSNFTKLLRRDTDSLSDKIEAVDQSGRMDAVEIEKVNLLIREGHQPDITITNFIQLLGDINSLYNLIVRLYKIPHTDLIIGSLDSGSDKSLDVIGVAQAMKILSKALLDGWDRVRFNKEQKIDKSFKSVSDGIDLLDKINKSASNKSISPEEAEKLKRTVIKNIDNLIGGGVYTAEIENRNSTKPSEISFERKLMITHQASDRAQDGSITVNSVSDSNPPEVVPVKKNVNAKSTSRKTKLK